MPIGRADLSGGNNNEFSPSAEAIGEFKLQTGAIGAQYNGGQTAVANFTIRSGTNDLHGSAFYYGQNEAFNAANLNTTTAGSPKAKYREHNYGYSVGGPVFIPKIYDGRNKTFFFTNLEWDDRNQQQITGLGTVPRPNSSRAISRSCSIPAYTGDPRSGTQVGTDALGRPIVFGQIYDPSTTRRVGDAIVRDPFPGQHHSRSALGSGGQEHHPEGRHPGSDTAHTAAQHPDDQRPACVSICKHGASRATTRSILRTSYRAITITAIAAGTTMAQDDSCRSRTCIQFVAAADHSRPPWHASRLTSTISPTIINRAAAGFNRFLNQNGAYPTTINADLASGRRACRTCRARCSRLSSSTGRDPRCRATSIARMGVGFADTSPNGSWIYQDDLTWLQGAHTFPVSATSTSATSITIARCPMPGDLPSAPGRPTLRAS